MKTPRGLIGVLIIGLMAAGGCGKSEKPPPAATEVTGIDATQFRPAFASASPEVQAAVNKVMMSIQGSLYKDALVGLDKLAQTPGLTDPQKKAVADLSQQVTKQIAAMAKQPGAQ